MVYLSVTAAFVVGLRRRSRTKSDDRPFVSIVVAARNEEAHIAACLDSLLRQTYPVDRYEILVVDDDSTDRTRAIVAARARVTCLSPDPAFAGYAAKKRPMATGVSRARGDLVLTTDADCTAPDTWVETIVAAFADEVDVVAGVSSFGPSPRTFADRFQAFDFHALLSAAAGAAGLGWAWAASGQNFAFRRRTFDAVGGYARISDRPSGDDVLLLQLFRRAGARFAFCPDPAARVTTWRHETLSGLLSQRKRWASNAPLQLWLNPAFFAYVASVFCVNALPVAATVAQGPLIVACAAVWALRVPLDFAVVHLGARRFGSGPGAAFFPVWLILQVPYVLLVGIGGSCFGFAWKDRAHRPAAPAPAPAYTTNDQPDVNHAIM